MGHETPAGRDLVDPELLSLLDGAAVYDLRAETLAEVRAASAQRRADLLRADAPRVAAEHPEVEVVERTAPGPAGAPPVPLLHYRSRRVDEPTPAVVWCHGGGYLMGAPNSDDALLRRLVDRAGVQVLSVDYRLAPEHPAPAAVEDAYAVLTWAHEYAAELRVGPLAIGGASAGGGLAAALALYARDRGEIPVAAQYLVYPMLDDRTGATHMPPLHLGEFLWTAADNRFAWGAYLGTDPGEASPYAAPSRAADLAGLPPAFVMVGALDLFAEEDIDYATRLLRAAVPTELHVYPGAFHAFDKDPSARVARQAESDLIAAAARLFDSQKRAGPS